MREIIKIDIKEANENSNILCASFDLQKVLNTPRAEICYFTTRENFPYTILPFTISTVEKLCAFSGMRLQQKEEQTKFRVAYGHIIHYNEK